MPWSRNGNYSLRQDLEEGRLVSSDGTSRMKSVNEVADVTGCYPANMTRPHLGSVLTDDTQTYIHTYTQTYIHTDIHTYKQTDSRMYWCIFQPVGVTTCDPRCVYVLVCVIWMYLRGRFSSAIEYVRSH